jgi:hypothetical protein
MNGYTTLNTMALTIMISSIITISIKGLFVTLSIEGLFAILSINDTYYK